MTVAGQILITGGAGFLGGAMRVHVQQQGLAAFAPTRQELDITNAAAVRRFLADQQIKTVLHFASRGVKADANDETLIDEELTMMRALCDGLPNGGTLFYAGSMSEYGRSGVLSESHVCQPQNAYARAKLEAGLWLRSNAAERGIQPIVGRIFGAFGPGEASHRLLNSVFHSLQNHVPIDLSDGLQTRDFVHSSDVAEACLRLVQMPSPPDCVNIGTGVGVQVRQVIEQLCAELGAPTDLLRFGARARSAHDMDELVADTALLQDALGWVPAQRLVLDASILGLMRLSRIASND